MSYLKKAEEMYGMIGQGQMMEAFEKFYHPDVVMIEGTGEERKGKDTNREFEKSWMAGIKEMHGGGVKAITSNEEDGVTMVEAWTDVTMQNDQRMMMEEIARQKWEGDHIVEERFYYKTN